jgi:hypothetical protein
MSVDHPLAPAARLGLARWSARPCLLALALSGCTWVSPADLQAKLGQVDDDADGYTATEDCNDGDATINPDAVEAWYDGIDADCGQDDDFDADADGFVAAANAGVKTEGLASSGNLPGGDCDDANAETRPGAADAWYDGADTDCDARDDYDMDGDGFVSPDFAGLPTANLDGSGALPDGDCDDDDDRINPAAVDSWYSGVDEDCSGNDDYDQDGDGQVAAERAGRPTLYVEGSGELPGGDCDDAAPSVFSGAAEDYYTAIDEDCEPGTVNFDQDGDGVLADMAVGGADDCDDTDPAVAPGAREVLGDGVDSDCDGGDSTFVMGGLEAWSPVLDSVAWAGIGQVRVDASTSTVWFTVSAEDVVLSQARGEEALFDAVVAFGVDLTAPEAGITQVVPVVRSPTADAGRSLAPRHDFVVDGARLLVGYGLELDGDRRLRLAGYETDRRARVAADAIDTAGGTPSPFDDVRVSVNSAGDAVAVGCEDTGGLAHAIVASRDSLRLGQLTESVEWSGAATDLCAVDAYGGAAVTLHTVEAGGLRRSTFTPGSGWTSPTVGSLFSINALDVSLPRDPAGRWLVAASDTVDAIQVLGPTATAPSTESELADPVSVNAAVVPATASSATPELVIGYADAAGDAYLAWGDPTGGWEVFPLAVDFAARSVAVWVDNDDNVYVAVAGEDDLSFGIARR